MQQRQPKGLSCVNGYGFVVFMPMGREKPRDYNSNDMHKMSWQLSSGCLARAYALAIFVHVSGGYVARAYVLATIE